MTIHNLSGIINGTAPNPVRFSEMCDQLGQVLGRPSWLPVPGFALKALLGEGASIVCVSLEHLFSSETKNNKLSS